MNASPEYRIIISPIGDTEAGLVKRVEAETNRIFGFHTEVIPLLNDIKFAFDTRRLQYNSTLILKKMVSVAPSHATKVLAITDMDIFIPILTYVYGEAQLNGKACIISTYRLKEGLSSINNPETFTCRVAKEAIHELCHTFNLKHCQDNTCIMHYCRSIKDVDKKSDQLCRYCRILLDDEIRI